MGLGLKKAIETAGAQITSSSSKPHGIYFTNNFQQKAKAWGLSEKDAVDVFYHGSVIKPNMMVKKYNGYELGIWFFTDHVTGQASITSIWKRKGR